MYTLVYTREGERIDQAGPRSTKKRRRDAAAHRALRHTSIRGRPACDQLLSFIRFLISSCASVPIDIQFAEAANDFIANLSIAGTGDVSNGKLLGRFGAQRISN